MQQINQGLRGIVKEGKEMANTDDMRMKFTVIKNDDIEEYLHPIKQQRLFDLLKDINDGRVLDLKKPNHKYLVINTDEPYADEIINILKRNGHWG